MTDADAFSIVLERKQGYDRVLFVKTYERLVSISSEFVTKAKAGEVDFREKMSAENAKSIGMNLVAFAYLTKNKRERADFRLFNHGNETRDWWICISADDDIVLLSSLEIDLYSETSYICWQECLTIEQAREIGIALIDAATRVLCDEEKDK